MENTNTASVTVPGYYTANDLDLVHRQVAAAIYKANKARKPLSNSNIEQEIQAAFKQIGKSVDATEAAETVAETVEFLIQHCGDGGAAAQLWHNAARHETHIHSTGSRELIELFRAAKECVPGYVWPFFVIVVSKSVTKRGIDAAIVELKAAMYGDNTSNVLSSGLRDFYMMAQNKDSNALSRLFGKASDKRSVNTDGFGRGDVSHNDYKLLVDGYRDLGNGISLITSMTLDCFMVAATMGHIRGTDVTLTFDDYAAWRGLSRRVAVRQLKYHSEILKRIEFKLLGTGESVGLSKERSVYGGARDVDRNAVVFRFTPEFLNALKLNVENQRFMYLPADLLKLDTNKNPHSYLLGRRIAEHKRINAGKPNENTIGVVTLINACPTLPAYDDVREGGGSGHISQQIIRPFERDMNALNSVFSWGYKGKQPTRYSDFIAAAIEIQWNNYPDMANLIANKKQSGNKTDRRNGKNKPVKE